MSLVAQHQQVWEVGLRLLGIFESIDGSDDYPRVALGEIFMTSFELTQLDLAERSPPAAVENQHAILIALKVTLRERRAVGPRGRKHGESLARDDGPRVRRQPGRQHEQPLGACEQQDHPKGKHAPHAALFPK
jgi:hypothetical protein